MTVWEYLRSRVHSRVDRPPGWEKRALETLWKTEWCAEFVRLMRNRMLMGCFRYGRLEDPAKGNYDHVSSMIQRLELYRETGNLETMVDVANLAMIEFLHSHHPRKHFSATDDGVHCEPITD